MSKRGTNIIIVVLLILGLMYATYLMLPVLVSMTTNIIGLAGMLLVFGLVIFIIIKLLTRK